MKQVLITGGSRGIGAAAVRAFSALGYGVAFFYEKNHEAAQQVAAQTGATAIACDVADSDAVREAVAALPPVEILVNNAAVAHYGLISQITPSEFQRLFAVNVGGVYHCVNAVLPAMLQRQGGCILSVASMWGQVGASCEAAYSASKGAVIALTKALAQELGPSGIRVNCVSPGVILTEMTARVGEAALRELAEQTPLGRSARPRRSRRRLSIWHRRNLSRGKICPSTAAL